MRRGGEEGDALHPDVTERGPKDEMVGWCYMRCIAAIEIVSKTDQRQMASSK